MFQGNRVTAASGERGFGAPEDLYGKPVDLALARAIVATSLLNGWAVEAGDIDGAYLAAPLRGPPVYMRLTGELWRAVGAECGRLRAVRGTCVRLQKAFYGLPRSGFGWFAPFDSILTPFWPFTLTTSSSQERVARGGGNGQPWARRLS